MLILRPPRDGPTNVVIISNMVFPFAFAAGRTNSEELFLARDLDPVLPWYFFFRKMLKRMVLRWVPPLYLSILPKRVLLFPPREVLLQQRLL